MKDQECATCEHIFKCDGKPEEMKGSCLKYKERRKTYRGRETNVQHENNRQ